MIFIKIDCLLNQNKNLSPTMASTLSVLSQLLVQSLSSILLLLASYSSDCYVTILFISLVLVTQLLFFGAPDLPS
jgi:hypothetical protein